MPNRFSIFHRGPSKGPDFEAWREDICRGFCRLDIGPAERDYIDCHNEFAQVHSKVSDIAYTVGFNDLSYFHKSFRRRFGVTPADMRTEFDREH